MKVLKMLPLLLLLAGSTAVQAQDKKDSRGVYTYVDKMPEFTGNVNAYLASNIKYPEKARKANVQGRSVVKFVVDEQGRVQDAMVEVKANPMLDAEAVRVVNSMPAWKPGMQKGKPVKVYYRIPVKFMLDDSKG
jgi:protein TonB